MAGAAYLDPSQLSHAVKARDEKTKVDVADSPKRGRRESVSHESHEHDDGGDGIQRYIWR